MQSIKEYLANKKIKKAKRVAKRKELVKQGYLANSHSKSWWKELAWKSKSLRCRIEAKRMYGYCLVCLYYGERGPIEDACHIARKTQGNEAYFANENLFGGCKKHNGGEHWYPKKYRNIYIAIFGREHVEKVEKLGTKQYEIEDYGHMILEDKIMLMSGVGYGFAVPQRIKSALGT